MRPFVGRVMPSPASENHLLGARDATIRPRNATLGGR